eukprot:COSAG06_NODE_18483_length_885_cov_1.361323_2_plen_25_part_01
MRRDVWWSTEREGSEKDGNQILNLP